MKITCKIRRFLVDESVFSTNKSHWFASRLLSRSRNSEFTIYFTCSSLFFTSLVWICLMSWKSAHHFFSALPPKILFTLQLLNMESQIQAAAEKRSSWNSTGFVFFFISFSQSCFWLSELYLRKGDHVESWLSSKKEVCAWVVE